MTETSESTATTRDEARRQAIYLRLENGSKELHGRLGGLPSPAEAEDIWGDIWYEEAHHSTGLAGNRLPFTEVKRALGSPMERMPASGREQLEVQGYGAASHWVYEQALSPIMEDDGTLLSLRDVRYTHAVMISSVWERYPHPVAGDGEGPGCFRRHDIEAFPGGMTPPSWTDVPAQMSDWIGEVNRIRDDDGPRLEAVARCHAAFERIHPFLDGNGRTGRLLTNLILLRLGYPPILIYKEQRDEYRQALQGADAGAAGPLGEFLARSAIDVLYRYIVPAIAGPHRLVSLRALADDDLTREHLSGAARRGTLRAQKGEDGLYYSTRHWVEQYRKARCGRATGHAATTHGGSST